MREKLYRFMQGRYGVDALSKFMMVVAIVFMVINMVTKWNGANALVTIILVLVYFRMLSRNIPKRYAENQKYLQVSSGVRAWWYRVKRDLAQRKTHRIFYCPNCKQKVRVPKGKGRIEIRCPKCYTTFVKKS